MKLCIAGSVCHYHDWVLSVAPLSGNAGLGGGSLLNGWSASYLNQARPSRVVSVT
jgi:hypothetical protein